jgi:hypothetical protein
MRSRTVGPKPPWQPFGRANRPDCSSMTALVDAVAHPTEALVMPADVCRQRLVHGRERDRPTERLLDSCVDVPHPQRSSGLLENGCHGFEHTALAAAKGATGVRGGLFAAGQQVAKPHQPWELNLESRVQECSA